MRVRYEENAARVSGRHFLVFILSLLILLAGCGKADSLGEEAGIFRMVVIDVGQGDSILLLSPTGGSMLVDCGTGQSYGRVVGEMKARGVTVPDVIVGTHPHTDHVGSLPGILKNIGAGRLYMNGADDGSRLYAAVLREAAACGLEVEKLRTGDALDWDPQVQVDVLGPLNPNKKQVNNSSVILRVQYGDHVFLLTGDAELEEEMELLQENPKGLHAQVVKIPHHGSASSSSLEFVQAVGAKVALNSHGENTFGHPNAEVIRRWRRSGAEVYSTAENGTLTVESDGQRLWIEGEKNLTPLAA